VPYEQLVNGVSLFFCVVDVSKGISKQIQTIVGLYYSVQDKAWFDERTVDNISAPYVATAPERIVLILFLDAFSVHQMESVVSRIQTLGVEVVPIPGGYTCVIQPC
jgi:hypothetical protein